jgi:hypothetical protein
MVFIPNPPADLSPPKPDGGQQEIHSAAKTVWDNSHGCTPQLAIRAVSIHPDHDGRRLAAHQFAEARRLKPAFTALPGLEEDPIAGLKDQAVHMFQALPRLGGRCAIVRVATRNAGFNFIVHSTIEPAGYLQPSSDGPVICRPGAGR